MVNQVRKRCNRDTGLYGSEYPNNQVMMILCNSKLRSKPDRLCRAPVTPGSKRCYYHGGGSTGPRTEAGLRRALTAAYLGKKKWFEQRRAACLPLPGRPKGAKSH